MADANWTGFGLRHWAERGHTRAFVILGDRSGAQGDSGIHAVTDVRCAAVEVGVCGFCTAGAGREVTAWILGSAQFASLPAAP